MLKKIGTSTFNLTKEQRDSFARSRNKSNDNHVLIIERKKEFGEMLDMKFTERANNGVKK